MQPQPHDPADAFRENLKFTIMERTPSDSADAITISISPQTLSTPNGVETISVQWNNPGTSSSSDWIGIYSPETAEDNEYLQFLWVPTGRNSGTQQFEVWNLRDSYQARYFEQNPLSTSYVMKAESNIATVNPQQPLQPHLSLTERSPSEMQIRWVSSLVDGAAVKMGTSSGHYTSTFDATHYSYDTSNFCGGTASIVSPIQFRDPGIIYTVIADQLEADSTYYYMFGHDGYWSEEHSFRTSSSDRTKAFQFVMYGDQGTYSESFGVIEDIESILDEIDLVLHIGDLSYGWGNGYTLSDYAVSCSKCFCSGKLC